MPNWTYRDIGVYGCEKFWCYKPDDFRKHNGTVLKIYCDERRLSVMENSIRRFMAREHPGKAFGHETQFFTMWRFKFIPKLSRKRGKLLIRPELYEDDEKNFIRLVRDKSNDHQEAREELTEFAKAENISICPTTGYRFKFRDHPTLLLTRELFQNGISLGMYFQVVHEMTDDQAAEFVAEHFGFKARHEPALPPPQQYDKLMDLGVIS